MKILEILFKRAAFMPFPEYDLRAKPQKVVVYGELGVNGYTQKYRPEENPPACGPHFKHRKFWFFSKREGWAWGNKKRHTKRFVDLTEDEQTCVAKFSQRSALKASTQSSCYFNAAHQSVVIDLDEWEAHLKRKAPDFNYIHKIGIEVSRQPREYVNNSLDNLFK